MRESIPERAAIRWTDAGVGDRRVPRGWDSIEPQALSARTLGLSRQVRWGRS